MWREFVTSEKAVENETRIRQSPRLNCAWKDRASVGCVGSSEHWVQDVVIGAICLSISELVAHVVRWWVL